MNLKNPVKAIYAKCLDCCCGQRNEVVLCPAQKCPLWPFRLGKNPYIHRTPPVLTEEQRKANTDRLKAMREKKRASMDESKSAEAILGGEPV